MKKVNAHNFSKKGELEFIESIMILVVITMLIVVGLVIYYKVSIAGTEEASERISEVESSVLTNIIDSMPEVECSIRGIEKDCVDLIKLQASKDIIESKKEYYDKLGFKTIRFEQIYPPPEKAKGNGECLESNFGKTDYPENCGNWTLYTHPKPKYNSKKIMKTPVSLYYPIGGKYTVGVLSVEAYS